MCVCAGVNMAPVGIFRGTPLGAEDGERSAVHYVCMVCMSCVCACVLVSVDRWRSFVCWEWASMYLSAVVEEHRCELLSILG